MHVRQGSTSRAEFTLNTHELRALKNTDKLGTKAPSLLPTSQSQDSRGRTWQLPWAMPPGHHVSSASNADAPSGLPICTPFLSLMLYGPLLSPLIEPGPRLRSGTGRFGGCAQLEGAIALGAAMAVLALKQ